MDTQDRNITDDSAKEQVANTKKELPKSFVLIPG